MTGNAQGADTDPWVSDMQNDASAVAETEVPEHAWIRARAILVRYVGARIGDAHEVEDVVQECLIAAAMSPRRETGDPLPFLLGTARHKTADWWRDRGRGRSVPVAEVPDRVDDADGPLELAVRNEDATRARTLLQALPERDAELLMLRMAGCSASETAGALGMNEGSVRVAQHRALAKLRALM